MALLVSDEMSSGLTCSSSTRDIEKQCKFLEEIKP